LYQSPAGQVTVGPSAADAVALDCSEFVNDITDKHRNGRAASAAILEVLFFMIFEV
jgi:hypothetical protein